MDRLRSIPVSVTFASVVLAALLTSACVGQLPKGRPLNLSVAEAKQRISDMHDRVVRKVTKAHIEECRSKVATFGGTFGLSEFETKAQVRPMPEMTCLLATGEAYFIDANDKRPGFAYFGAPLFQKTGWQGIWPDQRRNLLWCRFEETPEGVKLVKFNRWHGANPRHAKLCGVRTQRYIHGIPVGQGT